MGGPLNLSSYHATVSSTSKNSSTFKRERKSIRTNAQPSMKHRRDRSDPKFEAFIARQDTPYMVRGHEAPPANASYGLIEIDIVAYDPEYINVMMTVPRSTLISQIIVQVVDRLHSISAEEAQLVLRSKVLKGNLTLEQADVRDRDSLYLVVIEMMHSELAPVEMLPRLTTSGYSLQPSIIELARMTLDQLRRVRNFTVQNQHGRIEFEGTTDVTRLDIDQIVQIEASTVCVYPDDAEVPRPREGHGLNRPAKVTLYNCKQKKPIPTEEFIGKIKKYCIEHACEFISYNPSSGTWSFKVKHF
jgi:hypothetical protein